MTTLRRIVSGAALAVMACGLASADSIITVTATTGFLVARRTIDPAASFGDRRQFSLVYGGSFGGFLFLWSGHFFLRDSDEEGVREETQAFLHLLVRVQHRLVDCVVDQADRKW